MEKLGWPVVVQELGQRLARRGGVVVARGPAIRWRVDAGMEIPAGIKSPSRDRDGEEVLLMSLHRDGDRENLPPQG